MSSLSGLTSSSSSSDLTWRQPESLQVVATNITFENQFLHLGVDIKGIRVVAAAKPSKDCPKIEKVVVQMQDYLRSIVLFCILSTCVAEDDAVSMKHATRRQAIETLPTTPCNKSNRGAMWTSSQGTPVSTIWICQDGRWIPHQVTPSTGKTQQVAGKSCKDVRSPPIVRDLHPLERTGSTSLTVVMGNKTP